MATDMRMPALAKCLLLVSGLISIAGCIEISSTFVPPRGVIYNSVRAPLTTEFYNTPVFDTKGEASAYYLRIPVQMYPSFGFNNADIDSAVRSGGLARASFADYELTSVLGIFARTRVIAYGEVK